MWSIKPLRLETGERIFLPVEQDGMPAFYPTYYVTRKLRDKSPNTQKNQLQELRILSRWEADNEISVEKRFAEGDTLSELEIQNLVDFCGYSLDTIRKMASGVRLMRGGYEYVKSNVKRFRLQTIREYLVFLCRLVSTHPDRDAQAKHLARTIKSYTPKSRDHLVHFEDKSLNDEQVEVVTEKLMPGSLENPFDDEALQFRNMLMLFVLYETGIRAGELLGLYVEDVDSANSLLKIRRRHHDPKDPRTYQPLAKTRERDLVIQEGLIEMLDYYIKEFRGRSKAARFHPVLFVGHHNENEGKPLTASGLQYVLGRIAKAFPVMEGVHPHRLRHHFNYRFSLMLEKVEGWDEMTPEEKANFDAATRAPHQGWSETGTQQRRYNMRYRLEVTDKALRQRTDRLKGMAQKNEDDK